MRWARYSVAMWSPLTPEVREEIRRFRLVFTCEDCAHFVAGEAVCDLLYPTEPHRRSTVEAKEDGDPLLFCKMFEAR
jgi:hypothetical protein